MVRGPGDVTEIVNEWWLLDVENEHHSNEGGLGMAIGRVEYLVLEW